MEKCKHRGGTELSNSILQSERVEKSENDEVSAVSE